MRTITKTLQTRLIAQAEEAEIQGLVKVAEHLTSQVENAQIRDKTASYTYSAEDLSNDVEAALWSAIIRTADYHERYIDAQEIQSLVSFYAENLINDFRKTAGIESPVGAYEPNIPGENRETLVLKVEDHE